MSDIKERLRLLRKKQSPVENSAGKSDVSPENPILDSEGEERKSTIDKLKQLISKVEAKPAVEPEAETRHNGLFMDEYIEGPGQSIEDLIPGDFVETPAGNCFRVKTEYPWHFYQGKVPLQSLLEQNTACLDWAASDPRLGTLDFRKAVFFDTETTGLDTGAGTYIFLAGFGYFQDRSFVVEQYFMRDFPEEPAVIHAMETLLKQFEYIVTYNGKTYDWPLLESRFIVNRRRLPVTNPPHLDLLFLSRRLFKHRLENCKLTSVEAHVLDFTRRDDLPGALLPDLYFKYVRSRDARFIHKSFSHNAHDIVSLAAIASEIIRFINNPYEQISPSADLYGLARLFETGNHMEAAETAFRKALHAGLDRELYCDAMRRLSLMMKKSERMDEAVKLWEVMIQTGDPDDPFPWESLAKYYEHQVKDYLKALATVDEALSRICFSGWQGRKCREELEYRRNRLICKRDGTPWHGQSI